MQRPGTAVSVRTKQAHTLPSRPLLVGEKGSTVVRGACARSPANCLCVLQDRAALCLLRRLRRRRLLESLISGFAPSPLLLTHPARPPHHTALRAPPAPIPIPIPIHPAFVKPSTRTCLRHPHRPHVLLPLGR